MPPINFQLDNGTGHFIVSEANGYRSREQGVIAKGAGKLPPGAVLTRLAADAGDGKAGEFVAWTPGATFGGVLFEGVDTTDKAVARTLIVRDAEVQRAKLALAGSPNDGQKATLYSAMGVLGFAFR